MGLAIHYFRAPTDYTDKLKRDGNRAKARAFWEYCDDVNSEMNNSERFYAQSWMVGKGTVSRWLKEFKHEYDRFKAAWELTNLQEKKEAGQSWGTYGAKISPTAPTLSDFEKNSGAVVGQERGEALNKNINNIYCPNAKRPNVSDDDISLSKFLFSKLSAIHPSIKEPDMFKWAVHIKRMIDIDKRTIEQITNMIGMIFDNNQYFDGTFWRSNILSTEKLRKQYDTIAIQIKSGRRVA